MPRRERLHAALSGMLDEGASKTGEDLSKLRQQTDKLLHGPTLLVCISTANQHSKIPIWEQHLSAGAACMNTLHAANAHGFEAQWLTAWFVYDDSATSLLGLAPHETIAGLIHIGSTNVEKKERPRPELDSVFKNLEE